jgi:hypothetical protein
VLLFRGIIAEHILQSKRRERKRERGRERERERERERDTTFINLRDLNLMPPRVSERTHPWIMAVIVRFKMAGK